MTIQAISTRYAGCYFRSRLEARWAVFFDALEMEWRYEPEGYELEAGPYLPDFYLPDIETWFEVKASQPTGPEQDKAFQLSEITGKRVIIGWGDIPNPQHVGATGPTVNTATTDGWLFFDGFGGDYYYAFTVCPWCGRVGLEFDARGARVCGYSKHFPDRQSAETAPYKFDTGHNWRVDDKCYLGNHPKLLAAYAAARSARFEHGDKEVW